LAIPRTYVFVDGENLVMRYQSMVAAGAKPKKEVIHIPDTFVWHPRITTWSCFDIGRVTYYTSATGDAKKLEALHEQVANVEFEYHYDPSDDVQPGTSQLVPRIYHKLKQSRKTRNVDINIVIDVMRTAHLPGADLIYILSGDGDYLPLIEEAGRHGKEIYMSAFSSGLSNKLQYSVDNFALLDDMFFTEEKKAHAK
jgi:uncharacterized LabA/DUF88 family protein